MGLLQQVAVSSPYSKDNFLIQSPAKGEIGFVKPRRRSSGHCPTEPKCWQNQRRNVPTESFLVSLSRFSALPGSHMMTQHPYAYFILLLPFVKSREILSKESMGERTEKQMNGLRAGYRPQESCRVRACTSDKDPSGIPFLLPCCCPAFVPLKVRKQVHNLIAGTERWRVVDTSRKRAITKSVALGRPTSQTSSH